MSFRKVRNSWGHFWRSLGVWAQLNEANFLRIILFGGSGSLTAVLSLICLVRPVAVADWYITELLTCIMACVAVYFGIGILYHWHKWDRWHKGL